jgi:hypothetical protein
MSKLQAIKAKLAAMLEENIIETTVEVKMGVVKTDKAVLEYDGELAEGIDVFVTDAETEERKPAADGEYVTEDNKVITVAEGKVVSIVDKEEEKVDETPETEDANTEDVAAEETPVEPEEDTYGTAD